MASVRVLKFQDSIGHMASTPSLKLDQKHDANGTKFPDALSYIFCLTFDVRLHVFRVTSTDYLSIWKSFSGACNKSIMTSVWCFLCWKALMNRQAEGPPDVH